MSWETERPRRRRRVVQVMACPIGSMASTKEGELRE